MPAGACTQPCATGRDAQRWGRGSQAWAAAVGASRRRATLPPFRGKRCWDSCCAQHLCPGWGGQACAAPHGRQCWDTQRHRPRVPAALLWPRNLQTRGSQASTALQWCYWSGAAGGSWDGDRWLRGSLGLGPKVLLTVEKWLCPAGTLCMWGQSPGVTAAEPFPGTSLCWGMSPRPP